MTLLDSQLKANCFYSEGQQEIEAIAHEPAPEEDPAAQECNHGSERNENRSPVHIPRIADGHAQFLIPCARRGKAISPKLSPLRILTRNPPLLLFFFQIEGKTYIGQGVSKPLARQNAAENALKSLLLEKMTAAAMKARLDADAEGPANPAGGDEAENKEGTEGMETNAEEGDEIPWSSLASFALYKLFLEWQNQGTVVPVPRPGLSPGKVKKEASSKPVVQKELPANALSIHPVMLLNQMKPGVTYTEVSRIGNPPNTMFTLGIDIDGQEYTGCGEFDFFDSLENHEKERDQELISKC